MLIEQTVRQYLQEKLDPISVVLEIPETPPKKYVLIEKTGRGQKDHINKTTIAIKSHAQTLYDAAALSEAVVNAMLDIQMLDVIGGVEFINEHNFTDTRTKTYRYQAIFTIYF